MVEVNFGRRDPRRGRRAARGSVSCGVGHAMATSSRCAPVSRSPRWSRRRSRRSFPRSRRRRARSDRRRSATPERSAATSVPSSPAGDALPVARSRSTPSSCSRIASGTRRVPFAEFVTGPKQNERRPDEVIVAAEVAPGARSAGVREGRNPQRDGDLGRERRARRRHRRRARCACALGSVGPTIVACDRGRASGSPRASTGMRLRVVEPGRSRDLRRDGRRRGAPDRRSPLDRRLPAARDRGLCARGRSSGRCG